MPLHQLIHCGLLHQFKLRVYFNLQTEPPPAHVLLLQCLQYCKMRSHRQVWTASAVPIDFRSCVNYLPACQHGRTNMKVWRHASQWKAAYNSCCGPQCPWTWLPSSSASSSAVCSARCGPRSAWRWGSLVVLSLVMTSSLQLVRPVQPAVDMCVQSLEQTPVTVTSPPGKVFQRPIEINVNQYHFLPKLHVKHVTLQ